MEKPGDPAATTIGSPRLITGCCFTGGATATAALAAATVTGAAWCTGTKIRQFGPDKATTTASCRPVRPDKAPVGHGASLSTLPQGTRAPPAHPHPFPATAPRHEN